MSSSNKTILHPDPNVTNTSDSSWPHDPRLPLPGNVGVDLDSLDEPVKDGKAERKQHNYRSLAGALSYLESESARKYQVMSQLRSTLIEEEDIEEEDCYIQVNRDLNEEVLTTSNKNTAFKVECKIETCPPSLKKGFQRLFSEITDLESDLTVITISQETENDMAVWSNEVEEEREVMLSTFIENAKDIRERIQECGYWADVIDPSSGQALNGDHRNETLFETDERFNQLGFTVEDLGCCKALAHKHWGTYVFVGVLFTNAPVDSHVFEGIREGIPGAKQL